MSVAPTDIGPAYVVTARAIASQLDCFSSAPGSRLQIPPGVLLDAKHLLDLATGYGGAPHSESADERPSHDLVIDALFASGEYQTVRAIYADLQRVADLTSRLDKPTFMPKPDELQRLKGFYKALEHLTKECFERAQSGKVSKYHF